jgi:erythromycin esterase-like protein
VAARGQYNLDQLCHQVFGKDKVFTIGFSTFGGTVCTTKQWGGDDSVMKLNPAIEGSHEYLLHLLAQNQ